MTENLVYDTYQPTLNELRYTFGGHEPVRGLKPGEVLTLYTEDCFGAAVHGIDDLPSKVCEMPYLNGVTGPFFVAGAEPGDTLAVHFLDIEPARDWGVSATFPHFGALTSTHTTATLQAPLEERVWRYDIDTAARIVRFQARNSDFSIDLPLAPMQGTVGVAPAGGQALSTITSDVHGGNLDTPEIRAGVTLYLPVAVHGALLALGDGHARQGRGEVSGVAVETAMRTTITVDVLKGVTTSTPRIETDDMLMSIGCARPLEDAARTAGADMVAWIAELTGLDTLDAYQLIAQAGDTTVGNVVDPAYTMLAGMPKRLLGGTVIQQGVHDRLRSTPWPPAPGGGAS
ncbi:acetamidase/formamidase family protein [Actinoplanes sp. NPDC051851]|uniref:acetamidase/formamidase family protein n=1 Tax=Actinoplanes sp. NPDC051851 TaxID=3154753 RepID=UPI0034498C3D